MKIISYSPFLFLFFSCKSKVKESSKSFNDTSNIEKINSHAKKISGKDFSGKWHYELNSETNELLNKTFDLTLADDHGKVNGKYCAVARNGNKIDCSYSDNISGMVSGDTLNIYFNGIFDKKAKGTAKIYFVNDSLAWNIIQSEGEVFAPKKCILSKTEVDKGAVSEITFPITKESILNFSSSAFAKINGIQINGSKPTSIIPIKGNVFILYFDGDNERYYLAIVNNERLKDYLLIGKSETIETAKGETYDTYIDFVIDSNLKIGLEYSKGKNYEERKKEKEETFVITKNNKVELLR